MYKKFVFILTLIIFSSSQLVSFGQNPGMAPQPPSANPQAPPALPQNAPPGLPLNAPPSLPQNVPSALPQNFPPIILISGKERESFQKVFIDKAKIGDEINVKLLMFDREPTESIKINSYGLPDSAKLTIKNDEKTKNRAEANLIWKPSKIDKGFHTIVIEVLNSKGSISRISLSYDIS